MPHAILVVGYTDREVIYYETGREDRRINNYEGERMSWDVFIESVERIKIIFRFPWTYNLTVFIKGELEQDTDKVWQRLADFMIGADHTSVLLGSYAVNALADSLEGRVLTEPEKEALSGNLEKSVYTRADNAKFISETFDDERLI